MDFTTLMHTYGYVIVFAATILNLSTVLVIAGLAVHQGYLELYPLLMIAWVGTLFFGQIYFFVGRRGSHRFLAHHEKWQPKLAHMNQKIERYGLGFTLGYRFLLGFRFIAPVLLGATRLAFRHFVFCDIIGATLWAICFILLGYYAGAATEAFLSAMGPYEKYVVIIILLMIVLVWVMHHFKKKKRLKSTKL